MERLKMLKSLKLVAAAAALSIGFAVTTEAGKLGLGREATPAEVKAWDIDIRPDGAGLPEVRRRTPARPSTSS